MKAFKELLEHYSWAETKEGIYAKNAKDVENALIKTHRNLNDFKALVSPAAFPYLEKMAVLSHELTLKRFGKVLQMYIPLYLSNECQNICTYCGFSFENKIKRVTLNNHQILKEVAVIKSHGFDHILLLSGEANNSVGASYFKNAIQLIKPFFSNISMEVQPLKSEEYEALISEGLNTVYVYQETYNKAAYSSYHPKGKKANYHYRLGTPERLGEKGVHRIGLGTLLGLEDWRTDSFFTALHLTYLEKKYWSTKYSVSFPRLRPAQGVLLPANGITDPELIQLICAYRIFNEEVELSLSTRESEKFRDHAIGLGITAASAGSKTNPGGYSNGSESLEQFEIADKRSPEEFAKMVKNRGYEPVWKDWDRVLSR